MRYTSNESQNDLEINFIFRFALEEFDIISEKSFSKFFMELFRIFLESGDFMSDGLFFSSETKLLQTNTKACNLSSVL